MSSFIFRYELDPDDGYISKIISGVFRSTKNRTNQQKKAPQSQPLPKHYYDKQNVSKYTETPAIYHYSTNSYELDNVPIGGLEPTSENPYHISISTQDIRQHLTETTQIQVPALARSQYQQSHVKNRPTDVLIEDYTNPSYKVLPQGVAKVNPVITYTPNTVSESTVLPTENPLVSHTAETTLIRNSNNTLLTELLQKFQGSTQQQSQLASNPDNVDVDYSIISLFKILNDFKRAKEIVGSSPDHQFYIESGAKDTLDDNSFNENAQKGLINTNYYFM